MNDVLVRARDLVGRPVVTLAGDRVAEVKDVVLGLRDAVLVGFTLRNPGFLGGPRSESLSWGQIHAIGPDAVMIAGRSEMAEPAPEVSDSSHQTVDIPVITTAGEQLGRVVDVVVATGSEPEVVGFEIAAADDAGKHPRTLLIPIGAMVSASEQAVVVPSGATHFVDDDLAGFGAAVDGFRRSLQEDGHAGD